MHASEVEAVQQLLPFVQHSASVDASESSSTEPCRWGDHVKDRFKSTSASPNLARNFDINKTVKKRQATTKMKKIFQVPRIDEVRVSGVSTIVSRSPARDNCIPLHWDPM